MHFFSVSHIDKNIDLFPHELQIAILDLLVVTTPKKQLTHIPWWFPCSNNSTDKLYIVTIEKEVLYASVAVAKQQFSLPIFYLF